MYVARDFKGESPADPPVQTPIKFELLINVQTAPMLGLAVPPSLLASADGMTEQGSPLLQCMSQVTAHLGRTDWGRKHPLVWSRRTCSGVAAEQD